MLPSLTVGYVLPCEPSMKVRDLLRLIRADGWYLAQIGGSHHQFKHPTKPGRVTIAGKRGDDVAVGTLNSVLRQAGLSNPSTE